MIGQESILDLLEGLTDEQYRDTEDARQLTKILRTEFSLRPVNCPKKPANTYYIA